MNKQFEVASGSVIGRDHLKDLGWRNNQDAVVTYCGTDYILALVADGCSAAEQSKASHNEVGAKLAVHILARCIKERIQAYLTFDRIDSVRVFPWDTIRNDVLENLKVIAASMGGSFSATIRDCFLFTLVGAIVTKYETFVFSIGDGIVMVNGELVRIGPFPNNQPPYLAYALVSSTIDPELCRFAVHRQVPTETIQSILVGTDGLLQAIEATEKKLPGKETLVGPIEQFWADDKYFQNPDQVRRKLALMNHAVTRFDDDGPVRFPGLLEDDTTLAVIRRKTQSGKE